MRGFRKRAFSALSWDWLLPRSASVPSSNEGVDVLAIANQLQCDPDIAAKTIVIVKKLLNEGKLTPARIDESHARIVKCKERLGKIQ
jgi:hypothetical protein